MDTNWKHILRHFIHTLLKNSKYEFIESCQKSAPHLHCLLVFRIEKSLENYLILPLKSVRSHKLWSSPSFLNMYLRKLLYQMYQNENVHGSFMQNIRREREKGRNVSTIQMFLGSRINTFLYIYIMD